MKYHAKLPNLHYLTLGSVYAQKPQQIRELYTENVHIQYLLKVYEFMIKLIFMQHILIFSDCHS